MENYGKKGEWKKEGKGGKLEIWKGNGEITSNRKEKNNKKANQITKKKDKWQKEEKKYTKNKPTDDAKNTEHKNKIKIKKRNKIANNKNWRGK